MSIKINHIDLQRGEHIVVRFAGSIEHSLSISWAEKDDLPTVSVPVNCKPKSFTISTHDMDLVNSEKVLK